ncbi:MAG: B3/B4 domain-containing protein [Candidatus Thorarchaeota archaeon]
MNPNDISDLTDLNVEFLVKRDGLSLSVTRLSNLTLNESKPDFVTYEQELFEEIRSMMTLDDAKDDPLFRSYRDLYWTFGMDPTKHRVSSEAVLRRILRGLNLWRISDLVDVVNLASAYHKIPIGLIDDSKRVGNLIVRAANQDEVFTRMGGQTITCKGREIVLADQEKIICYGYATHDSNQTKVTLESKDVLLVLYGALAADDTIMKDAIDITLRMIRKWVDCDILASKLYLSDS